MLFSISGANLRTGRYGIFPVAHVVDVEYNDFDAENMARDVRKERYLVNYLGSIESSMYKGNIVLCQAVSKIVRSKSAPTPHPTVLEITDKGIKILDKSKFNVSFSNSASDRSIVYYKKIFCPQASSVRCHDYFYTLKNVTFCGFHPREPRYFGFVSKHPNLPKYACHVFIGDRSTKHIAEACG